MTDRDGFSSDDLIRRAREGISRPDPPREERETARPGPESDEWTPDRRSADPGHEVDRIDTFPPADTSPAAVRDDVEPMDYEATYHRDDSPFGFERDDASSDSPTTEPSRFPAGDPAAPEAAPRTGLLLAIGALVVGVGVAIFVAGLVDDQTSGSDGPLSVGSCFNDPGVSVVSDIPQLDCSEPHDFEMIGSVKIEGDEFPGEDAVWDQSIATCTSVFEEYVGAPYATSIWFLHAFTPTAEGWDQGDRVANCLVFQFADDTSILPVTGSARGDAR